MISERFLFRSSITTTICTGDFNFTKSSDLNSDPSITHISSSNGGSTIAKPICSIYYEDLNPIIEDLQSISICGHVFYELCLQQCIEYCSNVKKKRCPVCKQAFLKANVSRLYFQSVGNLYQKLINYEDNPRELYREIEKLEGEVLGLRLAIERHQKDVEELSEEELDRSTLECVRLQERNMALAKKLATLKLGGYETSKKTILEGDVLNDVDWNSNSSSISEDLVVEKNYFSRSEAASDTRSEVHRPCNKNGVSGSKSAFWTNEDWEVNLAETPVSKVLTRNPVFVLSDTLAVEALQKMVLEVIVLLDIAKCLYDAIARMERAAEKGKAIAATVEGVLTHSLKHFEIECLGPFCLQSFLRIQSRIATVSPTDTVLMATKKMVEYGMSFAVVAIENKTRGILTSKDILMRVIAQNLPLESTPVEKVMTPNPECATVDTPIVDALHIMQDGKFLHLLVVDKVHITHAAIATVGSDARVSNDSSPNMMQKFWDSAMALSPDEEEDAESSFKLASESIETTRSLPYPSSIVPNTFAFKIQDKKGRMHRFNCVQRVGDEIDRNNLPHILYEDENHDNVVLASDIDLAAAMDHARLVLKLHLDHSGTQGHRRGSQSGGVEYAQSDVWASAYSALAVGAALIAGLSMLAYLRRNG
ncbi:unnamed protein product [Camellia sinensis]